MSPYNSLFSRIHRLSYPMTVSGFRETHKKFFRRHFLGKFPTELSEDADAVERLNESGELRPMLKPYKSPVKREVCPCCGGAGIIPCSVCNGSKKSPRWNNFMNEFIALRCMNCDEVGLTLCPHCTNH